MIKEKILANNKTDHPQHKQSAKIRSTVGFQLAHILKLKRRFIDLEMKKLSLSRTQWQVLLWMKILGPCSQKELLKNLDIDAAHLARVLEEFEKNNYVIRMPMPDDRRALSIQLTTFSKEKVMPHLEATLAKENAILLKGLSINDKKNLGKLLEKLTNNMNLILKKEQQQDGK
jgi:DNA-binding MarR family transcriptional regulator